MQYEFRNFFWKYNVRVSITNYMTVRAGLLHVSCRKVIIVHPARVFYHDELIVLICYLTHFTGGN